MDTFSLERGIAVGVADGVSSGAGFSITMAGVDKLKGNWVPGGVVGVGAIVSVDVTNTVGRAVTTNVGSEQALRIATERIIKRTLYFISIPSDPRSHSGSGAYTDQEYADQSVSECGGPVIPTFGNREVAWYGDHCDSSIEYMNSSSRPGAVQPQDDPKNNLGQE
jgi:hypothetical protein